MVSFCSFHLWQHPILKLNLYFFSTYTIIKTKINLPLKHSEKLNFNFEMKLEIYCVTPCLTEWDVDG